MAKRGQKLAVFGGINIFLLSLVSLLNDFSSEMIAPILPLLITGLGGTGLIIGLIGGMIDGLPNLLKVFSGYLSDRAGKRKKFVFSGYFISEFSKFMLFFAGTWKGILIFMGFNKLGKGIRDAPRDALIAESLPREKGRGFGIQRAFDTTGAILGSVSVLLLVIFFSLEFKKIIIIAALLGFLSLIPLYFLKEPYRRSIKPGKKIDILMSLRNMDGKLKIFILSAGIFALANFSYMFFVLKSASLFKFSFLGSQNPFVVPIMLYVLFNIFYAIFAIPFGKLSDSLGRRKIILAGYLLFAFVCFGFLFFSSFYAFIALFIIYGLVYALVVSNQRAIVADLSPARFYGTALGAFQTTIGIAAIISGVIAGLLFDINPSMTFVYGIVLSLIASFVLLLSYRKYPTKIEK